MTRAVVLMEAAKQCGKLAVVRVPAAKSLRDACIERGIDPDRTGYKVPQQRVYAFERIIPGVPDRKSPYQTARELGLQRPEGVRREYTRKSAANDAAQIAEGGTEAYVAAFCRLNNLK